MATKLDKGVVREVALNGTIMVVTLAPSAEGGDLVFREKGTKIRKQIKLAEVFGQSKSDVPAQRVSTKKMPTVTRTEQDADPDLVPLAHLEALVMMDGDEALTDEVRGRFWRIVRDARDRRRAEMGFKDVLAEANVLKGKLG